MHVVGDLKQSLAGLLTGTSLNSVTNLDLALSRAARTVAQKIDAPEATGKEAITLYNGVQYYLAPTILFGSNLVIIRRQGDSQNPWDYNYKVPIDIFTRTKHILPNGYMVDFEYEKGVGLMGIVSPIPLPRVIIDPMSNPDDWTASGTASTPVEDTANYYQPPASLRTNVTVGTGILTNNLPNALDLSAYQGVGVVFLAIQTPSASLLTSCGIRLGSSATDYYAVTETEGFLGAWQADNWLLVALDLAAASTTGSPNSAAIDYAQVRIVAGGTLTNFRVGGLWVSMPSQNEIIYQTSAFFKTAAGVLSNVITNDSDSIILNEAAYAILELESAKTIALQNSGGQYTEQVKAFDMQLMDQGSELGLYSLYRADNPSGVLRTVGSWYDAPNNGNY